MLTTARDLIRLAIAARVIARHDGFIEPEQMAELPPQVRFALGFARMGRAPVRAGQGGLAEALSELGPSYIKLGQFLATRPDLIGEARAADLKSLQDRMAPFGMDEARAEIASQFGMPAEVLFEAFGPPVAAASIAQVHRASVRDRRRALAPGGGEDPAAGDRAALRHRSPRLLYRCTACRAAAQAHPAPAAGGGGGNARALRRHGDGPADGGGGDVGAGRQRGQGPGVPRPGSRLGADVAARADERMDRRDRAVGPGEGLSTAGVDLELLGNRLIEFFLRHAMRDGFFHADMHPGNLFLERGGDVVAVDFGIMGRLSPKDRRFLAEILWGFITRDYSRIAAVHFDAGYVPQPRTRPCSRRRCGRSASRFSTARPRTSRWRGC